MVHRFRFRGTSLRGGQPFLLALRLRRCNLHASILEVLLCAAQQALKFAVGRN